jgi:hypothetical protein
VQADAGRAAATARDRRVRTNPHTGGGAPDACVSMNAGVGARVPKHLVRATCPTGRLAGHPGVAGDLAALVVVATVVDVLAGGPIRGGLPLVVQ